MPDRPNLELPITSMLDQLFPTEGQSDRVPEANAYSCLKEWVAGQWASLPADLRSRIRAIERRMREQHLAFRVSPLTESEIDAVFNGRFGC